MDWVQEFLLRYSYWAILAGVVVEGDITLLVAGMLAHEKLLGFGYGITFLAAMVGAVAGDAVAFAIGRHVRETVSNTAFYQKFHPRLEWLDQRFGTLSILLVKYIYGLRTASSVFWGVSRMGVMRFLTLTLVSCFVWVSMLTGLGFLFGAAITQFIDRHGAKSVSLGLTAAVAVAFWALHRWWLSPTLQAQAEKAGFTQRDLGELEVLSSPPPEDSPELVLPPLPEPADSPLQAKPQDPLSERAQV